MLSRLTLAQLGILFLSVALFLQLTFVVLLEIMQERAARRTDSVLHEQAIVEHMTKTSNLWSKIAVMSVRVLAYTDFEESPVSRYIADLRAEFDQLSKLLAGSPHELAEVERLRKDSEHGLELLGKAKDAWFAADKSSYHRYLRETGQILDDCTERSNKLLDYFCEQQQRAHEEQARSDAGKRVVLLLGVFVNVGWTIAVAIWFIARIAQRLDRIARNSFRLAHGVPLEPPLSGADEIARLDQDFHVMAEQLNESAQKERALVDNARDMICSLDVDGVFVRVNPAAGLLLDKEPALLIGKIFLDFVSPEDREMVMAAFSDVMSGKSSDPFEATMLAGAGNLVTVLISAYWSESESSLFCVMHDITQRRQIERMKRQFTAMITHDLRSPLTAIGNTLQLVAAGVYKPETDLGETRIAEASHNISRMLRLISDLLEMEKFDAAKLELEFARVDSKEIVEEAAGSVRAHAEQQQLQLDLQIERDGLFIEADRGRIVQVLVNLLANAIKFSPPGGTIHLTASSADDCVLIEVTDSGPGISEEDRTLIFEPYKQAGNQDGKLRIAGTGLGLAICKSIVEAHHGSIGVESASSGGGRFWIRLLVEQPAGQLAVQS